MNRLGRRAKEEEILLFWEWGCIFKAINFDGLGGFESYLRGISEEDKKDVMVLAKENSIGECNWQERIFRVYNQNLLRKRKELRNLVR